MPIIDLLQFDGWHATQRIVNYADIDRPTVTKLGTLRDTNSLQILRKFRDDRTMGRHRADHGDRLNGYLTAPVTTIGLLSYRPTTDLFDLVFVKLNLSLSM